MPSLYEYIFIFYRVKLRSKRGRFVGVRLRVFRNYNPYKRREQTGGKWVRGQGSGSAIRECLFIYFPICDEKWTIIQWALTKKRSTETPAACAKTSSAPHPQGATASNPYPGTYSRGGSHPSACHVLRRRREAWPDRRLAGVRTRVLFPNYHTPPIFLLLLLSLCSHSG